MLYILSPTLKIVHLPQWCYSFTHLFLICPLWQYYPLSKSHEYLVFHGKVYFFSGLVFYGEVLLSNSFQYFTTEISAWSCILRYLSSLNIILVYKNWQIHCIPQSDNQILLNINSGVLQRHNFLSKLTSLNSGHLLKLQSYSRQIAQHIS